VQRRLQLLLDEFQGRRVHLIAKLLAPTLLELPAVLIRHHDQIGERTALMGGHRKMAPPLLFLPLRAIVQHKISPIV
jgi:hypothetical protein